MPSVERAVPRERLFAMLDAAAARAHVWVSGPPGAGKTTLVASWVRARRLDCVWYHVDAGDSDLASFFFHLARASGRRGGRARTARLPHLTPEYRGGEAAFARRFFRALVARRRSRLTLVLDDVTEVPPDAALFLALREGIEELAGSALVVLISRQDPPPPLARLVVNGALELVTPHDLLLTAEEALALARAHAPAGAPPSALRAACERAAGWVAGVVLLAKGGAPAAGAPVSPRVFDYLAGELFDREDAEVRRVLEAAALPPAVPPALAAEICGSERAEVILGDLARRAYFTVRRGGSDPAFELHPLLREFLAARLRAGRPPAEVRALRIRVARVLEEAGRLGEAAELFLDAEAWEDAASLALAVAPDHVATGRIATLERWLRRIPARLHEAEPWLPYWLGECRRASDLPDGRRLLLLAWEGFERRGDVLGQLATCAAMIESIVLEWADFRGLDEWLERVEALRRRGARPPRELELRLAVATFGAMTFHGCDSPALLAWEDRVRALLADPSVPSPLRAILGSWFLVESAMRGDNLRAVPLIAELGAIVRAGRVDPPAALGWLAGEAVHHWHTGAPARAFEAVDTALALAADSGVPIWDFLLHLQGLNAALAIDDLDRARSYLAAAERACAVRQSLNAAVLAHEQGLVALRAGRLDECVELGRATATLGEGGAMPFFRCLGQLMLALAETARGDDGAARPAVEAARAEGGVLRSHLVAFLCDLCDALLEHGRGEPARARDRLRAAWLTARERAVAPDVWFSRPQLAKLCALSLEGGIETDHVRGLVRRLRLEPPPAAWRLERWPWPVEVRLLGRVEAVVEGVPLPDPGKILRPLELVAAMVADGRPEATEDAVANALWPDSEGDLAHHALENAAYRLRRTLGGVLIRRDGTLAVDPRSCWVDALAFESLVRDALAALRGRAPDGAATDLERAVRLYRGPFLPHREDPWVLAARARLRRVLRAALAELARVAPLRDRVEALAAAASAVDPALRAGGDGPVLPA